MTLSDTLWQIQHSCLNIKRPEQVLLLSVPRHTLASSHNLFPSGGCKQVPAKGWVQIQLEYRHGAVSFCGIRADASLGSAKSSQEKKNRPVACSSFNVDLTWFLVAILDVCWWCRCLILEAACPCNNNNNGFGTWTLLNVSVFPIGALISYSMACLSFLRSRTKPETGMFNVPGFRSHDL